MSNVIVVIGPGSIGQAIARRVGTGKHLLLADLRPDNAQAAATILADAGFEVTTSVVDVSSRASVHALVEKATTIGAVTGVVHAAGVSPSQASPAAILAVDLYGTALVLEELGSVIASGIRRRHRVAVRTSARGAHRRRGRRSRDHTGGRASRAANAATGSPQRLSACLSIGEAGQRTPSQVRGGPLGEARCENQRDQPRHLITPLARDELQGPRGQGYRRMIELCPARRAGTPDEVATVAALLMGTDGTFITGSDILIDGGVTASYWYGELAPK